MDGKPRGKRMTLKVGDEVCVGQNMTLRLINLWPPQVLVTTPERAEGFVARLGNSVHFGDVTIEAVDARLTLAICAPAGKRIYKKAHSS